MRAKKDPKTGKWYIRFRYHVSTGTNLWNYTVRNTGCYACPIRCYSVIRDDETAAKYNVNAITECSGQKILQICISLLPLIISEKA